MKVPLSWLRQYVPLDLPPSELAHKITMAGIEVKQIEEVGGSWDPERVIVGHVLDVAPHPNADRLKLPTVDLGGAETATVVCGAPNVAAGQKIAFAREGSMLFSARSGKVEPLKKAKIRGVESAGMVCSELELGLGEDHEGILVLDDQAEPGRPLFDLLGDTIFELEVTPNRVDCLSILGVAHEVAALTGAEVASPKLEYDERGDPIQDTVSIEIDDPALCPCYTASLITGVSIGPSPQWLKDALQRAGQRSINNIVDVTNYVMLEYGQPLHAFDFDKVTDGRIIVRPAFAGETLVTLDEEERKLDPPMLTIADPAVSIGLAGIMGGANTEMTASTTSVLLESASFDAINTRRTSAGLRLHTEAARRFERGLRADLAPIALRRATRLILEVAGGSAAKGIIDLYPGEQPVTSIRVGTDRIRQLLGMNIPLAQVERVLASLGFSRAKEPEGVLDLIEAVEAAPSPERQTTIWVIPPYWRSDIAIEDDVVEELARIIGYDSIPTTMLSAPIPHHRQQDDRSARERVRDALVEAGMQEVVTYPHTAEGALDAVGALAAGPAPLRISNPINRDRPLLRTSLRASVLETLESNRRTSRNAGIRLFEIGRVYLRDPQDETGLPLEKEMVVGVLSGPRLPISWQAGTEEMDFFDGKGVLESLFPRLGLEAQFEASEDPATLSGRTARLVVDGKHVGVIGEVAPVVLAHFGLEGQAVAMFEIDVEALAEAASSGARGFAPASRFPSAERDLALIVDENVPSADIQRIIDRNGIVAACTPFDVYSGPGVPAGKKSIAYRIEYRSLRGTLTSDQVDKAQQGILRQLSREFGAELRT